MFSSDLHYNGLRYSPVIVLSKMCIFRNKYEFDFFFYNLLIIESSCYQKVSIFGMRSAFFLFNWKMISVISLFLPSLSLSLKTKLAVFRQKCLCFYICFMKSLKSFGKIFPLTGRRGGKKALLKPKKASLLPDITVFCYLSSNIAYNNLFFVLK